MTTNEFDNAVSQAADDAAVYRLGSYGWKGLNDYDDETIGHAMWQENSAAPLDNEHEALAPWREIIAIKGGDFEGLMAAARLSIGHAILYRDRGRRISSDDMEFYELHCLGAVIALATAADRIREVFIATAFRKGADQYGNTKEKRWFISPFTEMHSRAKAAASAARQPEWVEESLGLLPDLAAGIHTFRERRNELVHELATEMGQLQQKIVAALREPPVSELAKHEAWASISPAEFERQAAEEASAWAAKIGVSIDTYKTLVEFSHHVFLVEHFLRCSAEPVWLHP